MWRGGGGAGVKEMGWQKARIGKNQDDSKMGWIAGMPTDRKKPRNRVGEEWVGEDSQMFLCDSSLKTNRKNLVLSVLHYWSLSFLSMEN